MEHLAKIQSFKPLFRKFICQTYLGETNIKLFSNSITHFKLKDTLLASWSPPSETSKNKVTVVGAGQVGVVTTFNILTKQICRDVVLVDVDKQKLNGEVLDLQHGLQFLRNAKVTASSDYKATKGSHVCIITAGSHTQKGQTRLQLLNKNLDVLKNIVPNLLKYSPNAILLLVTNPVDILTFIAWKISGLPKHKVIGAGTNLDTSRFHYYISKRLGVSPNSVHGYIIGEHGDSSVAVWSGVTVGGVKLLDLNPKIGTDEDKENWDDVHKNVVGGSYQVVKLKGFTSWAIGLSVSELTNAILNNLRTVHPVSVGVQGFHGISDEICLSLPAILGYDGVSDVIVQNLTENERLRLFKSVKILNDIKKQLKF